MSRTEYINQLNYLLQDISESERAEALVYYEDYFDEAGPKEEANVIATLGSPEKVAAQIKEGLGGGNTNAGEYTEAGYQDDRFREFNKVPNPREAPWEEDRGGRYHYEETQERQPRSTGNIVLIVLLCIFAIPIGIPLAASVFGVIMAAFGVLFGGAIAAIALTFAAFVLGVALIGAGIAKMFVIPGAGLLMAGGGLLSLAIGIVMLLVCIWVVGKFVPWAVRGIAGLLNRIFRRGRQRA